jgi:hypothetical protein
MASGNVRSRKLFLHFFKSAADGRHRFKSHADTSKIVPGLERAKILSRQLTGAAATRMICNCVGEPIQCQ